MCAVRSALAPTLLLGTSLLIPSLGFSQTANPDPWFSERKLVHFGASAELASNGYTLGTAFWDQLWPKLALGAGLGITAGVGKEVYDAANHGEFSFKDLTWDALGVATGLLVSWLLDKYLFAPRRQVSSLPPTRAAVTNASSEARVFLRDQRVDFLGGPSLQQLFPKLRVLEQP
jgi:putative lipoprotein